MVNTNKYTKLINFLYIYVTKLFINNNIIIIKQYIPRVNLKSVNANTLKTFIIKNTLKKTLSLRWIISKYYSLK